MLKLWFLKEVFINMNIITFTQRLQECRRRKYSSQQSFADAYMERYGMIRQSKKKIDNNMFGTIQSWEQGKSTPLQMSSLTFANYLIVMQIIFLAASTKGLMT